jgi:DNA (cytosine-5)-methyltransferase 1
MNELNEPLFLLVDLFCGAGGTTIAFEKSQVKGRKTTKVLACVNHDKNAIESHWLNHPDVKHFEEDIRTLDLTALIEIVQNARHKYPNAKLILWASLECTNFSKAKGGKPRDADSRTLAWYLPRYIEALGPEAVMIENVVEFMSWGEMDENGKPISKKKGSDWLKWKEFIKDQFNYRDEWRELNSANYGAYTSRNRLFGIFAKDDFPISFPEPTHSKNLKSNLFQNIQPWKPVRDVLDLEDEGTSIFDRTKPLADKTIERILAGMIKYVAGGDTSFIQNYYSGKPEHKVSSINEVCGTITTVPHQSLVTVKKSEAAFMVKYMGNNMKTGINNGKSLDEPCLTITTQNRLSVVFLKKWYSGANNHQTIDVPAGTLRTHDCFSLINCKFLLNPQYQSKGHSIDKPCFTLIARMDKAPPYMVSTKNGIESVKIGSSDSESMKKLKIFMVQYGIEDVLLRMLKIIELKRIQGFPANYQLKGSQADQKKFIGNSVEPNTVMSWVNSTAEALLKNHQKSLSNQLTINQ